MVTAESCIGSRNIRVFDCRNGFLIPYIEEIVRLFKIIGVRYSGFGNYETNGFVFARTGMNSPEFIKDRRIRNELDLELLSENCFTCFRTLEEFRKEFPQVNLEVLNAA